MSATSEAERVLACDSDADGHQWSEWDDPAGSTSYCMSCGIKRRHYDALASVVAENKAQAERIRVLEYFISRAASDDK